MKLLVGLICLGFASAFSPSQMTARKSSSLASRSTMLNDIDFVCIVNTADYCTNDECSLEDMEALINRLEEQERAVESRLIELQSLANTLDPFHEIHALKKRPGPLLDDVDTMCTVNLAEYCAQENCSLDDVDALVNRLDEQSQALLMRLQAIQSASIQLRTRCRMPLRDHEVDPLIKAIQSALSMDVANNDVEVITANGNSRATMAQ